MNGDVLATTFAHDALLGLCIICSDIGTQLLQSNQYLFSILFFVLAAGLLAFRSLKKTELQASQVPIQDPASTSQTPVPPSFPSSPEV